MSLLLLFFPLLSSFSCGFLGFYIGRRGSIYLSIFFLFCSFLASLFVFFQTYYYGSIFLDLGYWFRVGSLSVSWFFVFDPLSIFMLLTVSFVSLNVHVYSTSYMFSDPNLQRFMSLLSLFTFFMFILVSSGNFVILFLGWEGIGLCSYLLISFWSTRVQAVKSAFKALIVNRLGDFTLMLTMFFIYFLFGNLDFIIIHFLTPFYKDISIYFFGINIECISLISFLIIFSALGKSAQIGLHVWLPDAMEGPTPVSALIHAATLVTAGVFLLLRNSPILEQSPSVLHFLLIIGLLTSLMSAFCSAFQEDAKKSIAYSTSSQLGFMFLACGNSDYLLSFFHLINHAFFKALFFLCAGAALHSLGGEQEEMVLHSDLTPLTTLCNDFASLSLASTLFFGSFFSKDPILSIFSFNSSGFYDNFLFILASFSSLLAGAYSGPLDDLDSEDSEANYENKLVFISQIESDYFIILPLFILSFVSFSFGLLFNEFFSFENPYFFDVVYIDPINFEFLDSKEFSDIFDSFFPTIIGLIFAELFYNFLYEEDFDYLTIDLNQLVFINQARWLSSFESVTNSDLNYKSYTYFIHRSLFSNSNFFHPIKNINFFSNSISSGAKLINNAFFFDNIFFHLLVYPFFNLSHSLNFFFDRGFFELFGPSGLYSKLNFFYNVSYKYYSGYIYNYFLLIVLFIFQFYLIFNYFIFI